MGKKISTHLAYQSKTGPLPWTAPYTVDKLGEIAKTDPSCLVVVPLGFVSNNVETLYEIDILYHEIAQSLGIKDFRRISVPDDNVNYASGIADMLEEYILGA